MWSVRKIKHLLVALDEKSAKRRGILLLVWPTRFPGSPPPTWRESTTGNVPKGHQMRWTIAERKTQWESWLNDLRNLQKLQIPRCFVHENPGKVQRIKLHHFFTATHGYSQHSYVRVLGQDNVHNSLAMDKSRGAPTMVAKGGVGAQNWSRVFLDRFPGSLMWQTTRVTSSKACRLTEMWRWQIYLLTMLIPDHHSLSVGWIVLDHFTQCKVKKGTGDVVLDSPVYPQGQSTLK